MGKKINVKCYLYNFYYESYINKINFCSESGKILDGSVTYENSGYRGEINIDLVIPNGTKYIDFWSGSETIYYIQVNEIVILN